MPHFWSETGKRDPGNVEKCVSEMLMWSEATLLLILFHRRRRRPLSVVAVVGIRWLRISRGLAYSLKGQKFAAFSKIWPLTILRLLPFVLRTTFHMSRNLVRLTRPPASFSPCYLPILSYNVEACVCFWMLLHCMLLFGLTWWKLSRDVELLSKARYLPFIRKFVSWMKGSKCKIVHGQIF